MLLLFPKTCEIGVLSYLGHKLRCLRSLNVTDHQFRGNSLKSKIIILFYFPRVFLLKATSWSLFHLTTLLLLGKDIPSQKIGATSSLIFGVYDSSTSELGKDSGRGGQEGLRSVLSHGYTCHNFLSSVPWKTPLWNFVVFIVPVHNPWYYSQHLHQVFFSSSYFLPSRNWLCFNN